MKRFVWLLILTVLTGSLTLNLFFRYTLEQLFYHLVLMSIFIFCVVLFNIISFSVLRSEKSRRSIHIINYIIILSVVLFYISTAGSTYLWGRPIRLGLLTSYLLSLPDFISVLPLRPYIVYSAIFLVLLVVGIAYFFLCPDYADRPPKAHVIQRFIGFSTSKKLILIGITAAIIFILAPTLLQFKRFIHFRSEPLMEFVFGQMWESGGEETIFGKNMTLKTLNEKACIDSVKAEPASKEDRVVVVILFDGLRSSFLPAYGYQRPTTPFLDSLTQSGDMTVVNNAHSTSTTTLVGVAGLFGSKDWNTFAFKGLNLMKFLKIKGYKTYAFLTGHHRSWYGLTNIYRSDCDFFYESTTRPTEQNFDDFTTLKEIENTKIESKSFIYIHLLSTHTIGKKHNEFRRYLPDKLGLSGNKRDILINNYDNGILQGDFVVRNIFSKLNQEGLLQKSTVYIVSDHGELFGEDGRWNHSGNIHPALLQIPMLIYDKNPEWYLNRSSATIKDVAPSIAARLGYNIPTCWEGNSLGSNISQYSIKLHAGGDCDHPEGLLFRKDSLLQLEIYNRDSSLARLFKKSISSAEWVEQKNEN